MAGTWKQTINVNITLRSLSFSENGRYLNTDRGLLSLNSGSADTCLHPEQANAIFVDNEWVTRDGQNLLWLPKEYRTRCLAFLHNKVVLGQPSGQVTFLEFDL